MKRISPVGKPEGLGVAPTLRGGRGLKLSQRSPSPRGLDRSAHLTRWARIETCTHESLGYTVLVAPTLRGGRGLKHSCPSYWSCRTHVAPTLRGGRGLKHPGARSPRRGVGRSAHLTRWARIETGVYVRLSCTTFSVAPTLRGGRGLKHDLIPLRTSPRLL